ncbi:MAG: hypothetical protein COB12_13395 [Flavobacterium sp.]|nr:MAG: hypothetical protein COB12_13395 [Flavobacterium sp.]
MKFRYIIINLVALVLFFGCKNEETIFFEEILDFSLSSNEKAAYVTISGFEHDLLPSLEFIPHIYDSNSSYGPVSDFENKFNVYSYELLKGGALSDFNYNSPGDFIIIYSKDIHEAGMEKIEGNFLKYIGRLGFDERGYFIKELLYYDPSMKRRIKTVVQKPNKETKREELSFSAIRGRLIKASEREVKDILGKPDRELNAPMNGYWKILIYYSKVYDDFDNEEIKHLVLFLNDTNNRFVVSEIEGYRLGSTLRYRVWRIPLP